MSEYENSPTYILMPEVEKAFRDVYGLHHKDLYTKFPRVKKKANGQTKVRWINAPHPILKKVQRTILDKVLYRFGYHAAAHGYVNKRGIVTNARLHVDKKYLIVIDLKDFFPTITEQRVRETLNYYLSHALEGKQGFISWDEQSQIIIEQKKFSSIDLLLALTTHEGAIPQGAPTSGVLSNLVMYQFDTLIDISCEEKQIVYTRYADDLSFSGDDLDALRRFVFGYVFNKIREHGFQVNKSKIHVFKGASKIVTGLSVSENGTRPLRKHRRKVRARLAHVRNSLTKIDTNPLLTNDEKRQTVLQFLKEKKEFADLFSHLWYLGYTDNWSNCLLQWIEDYYLPIIGVVIRRTLRREHYGMAFASVADLISNFTPAFAFDKAAVDKNVANDRIIIALQQQHSKIVFNTEDPVEQFPTCLEKALLKGNSLEVKCPLIANINKVLCTYYVLQNLKSIDLQELHVVRKGKVYESKLVRRLLIHEMLGRWIWAEKARRGLRFWLRCLRHAMPEDREEIVEIILKLGTSELSWTSLEQLKHYMVNVSADKRIKILEQIEQTRSGLTPAHVAKIRLLFSRLMRGVRKEQLIGLLTSPNQIVRSLVQDRLAIEKNTADMT